MASHTEACGQLLGPLRDLLGFRQTALQRAQQGNDLTVSGTGLLAELVHGGESRASDLAHDRVVDASVVSRQLGHLEQEGLIERRPAPEDRRASLLRATERGREVLAEREEEKARWLSHALRDWDDEELVKLAELLRGLSCDLIEASRAALAGPDEAIEEGNR